MSSAALWWLALCNFVVGSAALAITGLLPAMAESLGVSASAAGTVLALYAVTFAISAPVVAVLAARVCRKQLLVRALVVYGVLTVAAGIAPSYALVLAARAAAGIAAAAFVPNASAVAGALAAPEQRGRALAIVFGGFTAALVLGAPLGTAVGKAIGWRPTLVALGVLALLAAWALRRGLPGGIMLPGARLAEMAQALRAPRLVTLVGINLLANAGTFVLFAYAALALPALLSAPASALVIALSVFGVGSVVGNMASVLAMDRVGAARMAGASLLVAAAALGVLALGIAGVVGAWLAVALWGLGNFISTSAQQTRLVAAAPALASALLPLNASAMFVGQAVGTAAGAAWLAGHAAPHDAAVGLTWMAAGASVLAAMVSQAVEWTARAGSPHPLAQPPAR